jgi:hypothetical protein
MSNADFDLSLNKWVSAKWQSEKIIIKAVKTD